MLAVDVQWPCIFIFLIGISQRSVKFVCVWVTVSIAYTREFYSCLRENEYHYFCSAHMWLVVCPVHGHGQVFCEVSNCHKVAKKYSHRRYEYLLSGEFHFFCQDHATNDCQIHRQLYYR